MSCSACVAKQLLGQMAGAYPVTAKDLRCIVRNFKGSLRAECSLRDGVLERWLASGVGLMDESCAR
jgi:hypothetical protein